MRVLTERRCASEFSSTLLVLLPPALATVDDYYAQGFVQAWREHSVPADLQLADLGGQQVLDKTAVADLHAHVVEPALAQGYRSIWFAGISLGAYSALLYAAEHAFTLQQRLAGLYLMGPYPGTSDILAEIRAAGSVAAWDQKHPSREDARAWWHWLHAAGEARATVPAVCLGAGKSDRFHRGQSLIAETLAPGCVQWVEGGHDWPTWKALWNTWLECGPLAPGRMGRPLQ